MSRKSAKTCSPADATERHHQASRAVLEWYGQHRRVLPWRALPGEQPDPYRVWLSEIMLQQTTVATVKAYFEAFTARWPSVEALAAASRDEIMEAWSGLGYYARARNLHACAVTVARDHGGRFPETEQGLRQLPGVGDYTAAAVAAIAFGERAVVVDGNIERVAARWDAVTAPLPGAKPQIKAVVDALTPDQQAGDFAQALMDIGARICTPARRRQGQLSPPDCAICPLAETCLGRESEPALLPVKKPKTPRPDRFGTALVVEDSAGRILFERRGETGMLGGMLVFPGSHWADGRPGISDYPVEASATAARLLAATGGGVVLNGQVEHVFSHFRVILTVIKLSGNADGKTDGNWVRVPKDQLEKAALPTVMRKVARLAGLDA